MPRNRSLAPQWTTLTVALALTAILGSAASGAVIHRGDLSIDLPHDAIGLYLDVVTGAFTQPGEGPERVPGWDVHIAGSGDPEFLAGAAAAALGGPQYARIANFPQVSNLPPWWLVGADTRWFAGPASSGGYARLEYGSDRNLIGFRFLNEATGAIHYGWLRIELGHSAASPRRLVEYAYESTPGSAIAAGDTGRAAPIAVFCGGWLSLGVGVSDPEGSETLGWTVPTGPLGAGGSEQVATDHAWAEADAQIEIVERGRHTVVRLRSEVLAATDGSPGATASAEIALWDPFGDWPGLLLRVGVAQSLRVRDRSSSEAWFTLSEVPTPEIGGIEGRTILPGVYRLQFGVEAMARAASPLATGTLSWELRLTPGPLGDLDGDGRVDELDLAILLANWGDPRDPDVDLDGDGRVDGADLAILLGDWGDPPPAMPSIGAPAGHLDATRAPASSIGLGASS